MGRKFEHLRTSIAQKESAFNTAFRGQPKKVSYSLEGAKVQEIKIGATGSENTKGESEDQEMIIILKASIAE